MKSTRTSRRLRTAALASLGFALSLASAQAVSQTWNTGGPTNNWNTTGGDTNWDAGVVWTQNNEAIFGGTAETVTLTTGISAGNLTFNSSTYTITGNTLTLASGGIINTGSNSAIINSVIAGGPITKSGTGTLTLGGTTSSMSGGVTLSQGILSANHANAMGATTNTLTLGDASTGANALEFKVDSGIAAAVTLASISSSNFGTSQTITINAGSSLGANAAGLVTTLKLDGTVPVTLKATQTGTSHSTAQDVNWRIEGTGIAAGTTALTLDGTAKSLRISQLGNTSAASNFTGDVLIKGSVTTQNRTYLAQTAANQNLGFLNNDVTVSSGATWTVVWGGETTGALNGPGTITLNNQNALNNIGLTVGNNNRDGSFTGSLGSGWKLAKTGTGVQEFSGTAITISGGVNLDNGTLKLTKTTGWNSNIAVHAINIATLQLNSALAADSWTFAKQITGGSTAAKIEKIGLGTVLLTPAASSSFVGSTTEAIKVSGGKLYLNNANFTTAPVASVAGGATFGGTGTVGNVTVASTGTIEGGSAGTGTLTAGNVTLGSGVADTATIKGSVNTTPGSKALAVTNLTLNGGDQKTTIDATGSTGLAPLTTYNLLVSTNPIAAPNATSVLSALKSNSRLYAVGLANSDTTITVTYDPNASVYWTGAASTAWNISATNFKLTTGDADTQFQANDVVLFHDTPDATETVDISSGNVDPVSSTFDNTLATAYTVQGSNGISTGTLAKTGDGLLTITNANSYTGGSSISNGRVRVGNNSALGGGAITFTGGALSSNGGTARTLANTVAINGPVTLGDTTDNGDLTLSSAVSGSGTLTKAGTGTLTLGAANSGYTGAVAINTGTLALNSASALGAGNAITIGSTGATNPTVILQAATTFSLGAISIPASVTGASISMPQNTSTYSHSIAGATLASPLTVKQSNANGINWTQVTWTSKITGTGAGSGSDTLVFNNTSANQNYYTTNSGVTHDFSGNVHVVAGFIAVQSGNPGGNLVIPDTAMLTIDATNNGRWGWNNGGMVETMDGLAGSGQITNPQNLTLTINAGNADNEGDRVFSGTLGNMGGAFTKSGSGTQEFSGTGVTFNNTTNLNDGTLKLTKTTGWNSNVAVGVLNSPTLQLNSALVGDSWTFAKQITGGSTSAKIEKTGAGTVILSPAASSSFFGTTAGALTVTDGKLYLNNANFTTPPAVSVAAGKTFGGSGTAGAITVASGATLEGGYAGAGVLTASSLTFSGTATLSVNPSTTTAPVSVSGALTTSGVDGDIIVELLSIPPTDGTYHLIQYNSINGEAADFVLSTPSRAAYITDVNPGFIDLVVDASNHPVWDGSTDEWSTNELDPKNWLLSGDSSPTDFIDGDVVEFNDDATGTTDIRVDVTNVAPGSMTFDFGTAITDYYLGGGMDITSGSLTKRGDGTLFIDNAFSFSGGSTLEDGTVSIATEAALGTGTRTLNGGILKYTGSSASWSRDTTMGAIGGTLNVFNSGATITHGGALTGTGILTKAGAGTLSLPYTTGTISTPIDISAGTLKLAYGTGAVTYSSPISGAASSVLNLEGTGASATTGLTLTGTMTFAGDVHVNGRRIFLDNPGGNALGGANIRFKISSWPWHDLTINRDEQIADASVLRWENSGDVYEFRLNGHTETVGGLVATQATPAIIENAGYDNTVGNDNNIPAGKLMVDVANGNTFSYYGSLRNQNGGSNNAALSFEKKGLGTQTLVNDFSYTGTTTVNEGTLVLQDPTGGTAFASSTVIMNGGTLEMKRTTGTWTYGDATKAIVAGTGMGNLVKSGAGTVILAGTNTYTGTTTISEGTLQIGNAGTLGSLGMGAITNNAALAINRSDAITVNNVISGTGTLAQDGAGTLTLGGANTYTGNTTVAATTTMDLASGGGRLTFKLGDSGATNSVGGAGTANFNGAFAIDTTAVTDTTGTWNLVTVTNKSYHPTSFSVTGFADPDDDGKWTKPAAHVAASEWTFNEADGTLTLAPAGGYANWKSTNAPTGTAADDFDGDGVPNGVEYVLGGDKDTNDLDKLPDTTNDGTTMTFTFLRDQGAIGPDTSLAIQVDGDLIDWPTSGPDYYPVPDGEVAADPGLTVEDNLDGTDTITLTVTMAPDAVKFARLRVIITE